MGDGERYSQLFQGASDRGLGFRVGEGEQQRNRNRIRALLAKLLDQELQILLRRRMQDFTVAAGAFVNPEAQIFRNERLYAIEEKIVKFGPGLAADLDGVFKSGGYDQGHAGALALQQSIGADGSAVQKNHPAWHADLFQGCDDGFGRIVRSRKNLEHAGSSAFDPHTVGESATGVDGDLEKRSWWAPGHES